MAYEMRISDWISDVCSSDLFVYDLLCRSPLGRSDAALALVGFVFLVALAYLFTLVFSGRGMMMQLGGLIGTMMVANVFLVIIPNQKMVVADLLAGRQPDPKLGAQAKQRSLHNNYLTLPVILDRKSIRLNSSH